MSFRSLAFRAIGIAAVLGLAWLALDVAGMGGADAAALWDDAVVWIAKQQRLLHRELADHLGRLKADGGAIAAWGLIVAGFAYGVVHAIGPGHGKAVLATYLLTHRERLRRGIVLATVAAYCQGAVAIVLIHGLARIAGWLPRETSMAVTWSERFSFALIAAIGIWLAIRAVRHLFALATFAPEGSHGHAHRHGEHDHRLEEDATVPCTATDHCGHSHGPSARQIDTARDFRTSLGIIASIGFRPCSGAILVLALANALGLAWAGVAAVVAMSTGTAIATTALAVLAVLARSWAARLAAGRIAETASSIVMNGFALAGGIVIVLFGALMLAASFAPAHPLGL